MKNIPPEFPFFEVPAVARSVLPVWDVIRSDTRQSAVDLSTFAQVPHLHGIIDSIRSGNIKSVKIPVSGFDFTGLLNHNDAYDLLGAMGENVVQNDFEIGDKNAEKYAYLGAVAFGKKRADKPMVSVEPMPLYTTRR